MEFYKLLTSFQGIVFESEMIFFFEETSVGKR